MYWRSTKKSMHSGFMCCMTVRAASYITKWSSHPFCREGSNPGTRDNEINRTVHEILFHIVNTYKKVKRGELWIATSEINCVIKENLLRMIEYHNARVSKKNNILTYEGRLLENRTDPRILRLLTHCFVSYDERSVLSGLEHVLDLTHMMYREICTAIDREADEKPIASVRKIIREMKQDA